MLDRIFERESHAHSAADAECRDSLLCVALQHLVQECHRDARSAASDGMSESDRASVDVKAVTVKVEDAIAREHLGGESFVQFNEAELMQAQTVLVLELLERGNRPIPMIRGSTPTELTATMRASGLRLFCFTKCSLAMTIAAAPSVMPEEFPAEMVPVFENTGGRLASFSMLESGNGCSSRAKVVVPFLPSLVTRAISASKRPAAIARAARVCDTVRIHLARHA